MRAYPLAPTKTMMTPLSSVVGNEAQAKAVKGDNPVMVAKQVKVAKKVKVMARAKEKAKEKAIPIHRAKAEKVKAAAMKKLRKIEEEEDDVEPSDVARGKGKMRRIK